MRLHVVITSLTPVLKLVNFFQVLQSVQALVHPVQMQRLTIQPINLLVSIHASLKLYIASDHTPLSFSLFERGPLCTTARQLVHALAMHYAAGALFRAGRWRMKELQTQPVCISHIHTELAMFHNLILLFNLLAHRFPIQYADTCIHSAKNLGLRKKIHNWFSLVSCVELRNDYTHGLPLFCGIKSRKTVQVQEAEFQNRFRLSLCHNLLFDWWLVCQQCDIHQV